MNSELSIKFGSIIRSIRIEKLLSQEQLATKAHVHRTYIGMIERGERNITLENIDKVCKGLDISMEYVFHKLNSSLK